MFYILLALGFILRILLIPLPGFRADVAFWKGWGLAVSDKGILWLVNNTNYNYPPGFAYVLTVINKIYALFKNPYDVNEYWADTNLLYLFLIKAITIVSDLIIVWLIIKIIQKIKSQITNHKPSESEGKQYQNPNDPSKISEEILQGKQNPKRFENLKLFGNWSASWRMEFGALLALIYFLNPVAIYDGVMWGQVDQFGLMLFLLSAYLLLIGKLNTASVVFVVSCMMKFQNIIFIPLFYLYVYKHQSHWGIKEGFSKLCISLGISFFAFLAITLPFWVNKEGAALIRLLTINSDWFPYYSLNAFNMWWIASGLKGMQIIDKNLIIGIVNAKQLGLFLFIIGYFIAAVNIFFAKKEDLFKKFILSLSLATFAFFHLLTQSHERYLFPLIGFLAIYMVFLSEKERLKFFILYSLFSILFFLNIYISMVFNYSDQTIWFLNAADTTKLTWWISVLQISVFIFFVLAYVAKEIRKQAGIITGFIVLLAFFIMFQNLPYLFGKPISLTSLKPTSYTQDFLMPIYNKNLNSFLNPTNFDRLSSNYFFYNKGIATHANSVIVYDLNRKFSRFRSDYGLDTEAGANAEVYFLIEGDGKKLFQSRKKGRFENPSTIEVNIKGVNRLVLKVEKAGYNNFGAHADWLDPVLIK